MFKNVLPEPYWMCAASSYRARKCLGTGVGMAGAPIDAGATAGARSKLAKDCGLNSPMMRLCEFLTKLFTKRFTYKVEARSSES